MDFEDLLHPADLRLVRYIRLRKARDEGNNVTIEPHWLGDFQNEVNMPLHDTRIRFGMARQFARHIDLVALAPSKIGGMETLELAAYFDEDKPRYHLAIFDTGMSKRAEYSFHSIVDPKIGLFALLKDEYGDEIKFTENR